MQAYCSRLRPKFIFDSFSPLALSDVAQTANFHILIKKNDFCPPQSISRCKIDHLEHSFPSLNKYHSNGQAAKFISRTLHTAPTLRQKQLSKHVRQDVKFSEKAKEATKTTYYAAVVLAGFGITGILAYTIFKELFSSFSPQSVYSDAVEKCSAHPRVQDMLGGDSLKCYGEESRRGRRQHVSHVTYEVDGQKGMRIMFHLKGSRRTGRAQLDVRDSMSGWYYRYLYVQLDQYPHEVIVVQDNRGIADDPPSGGGGGGGFSAPQQQQEGELKPIFPSKL